MQKSSKVIESLTTDGDERSSQTRKCIQIVKYSEIVNKSINVMVTFVNHFHPHC